MLGTVNSRGCAIIKLDKVTLNGRPHYVLKNGPEILYKTRTSDTPSEKVLTYLNRCVALSLGEIKSKMFLDKVWA